MLHFAALASMPVAQSYHTFNLNSNSMKGRKGEGGEAQTGKAHSTLERRNITLKFPREKEENALFSIVPLNELS